VSAARQPLSHEFSELVHSAHPEMSTAQTLAGWHALRRRSLARERTFRRLRLAVAAATLAGAALAVGVFLGRSLASTPLRYSLSAGTLGEDGQFRFDASNPANQSALRFSDGAEVRLGSSVRGRLVSVTHDGARLRLADGEAEVKVPARRNSNWEFDAGPYGIFAQGAEFFVRFREREQILEVGLRSGTVRVEGPLANDGITLHGGQQLTIRKPEGEVVVRDLLGGTETVLPVRPERTEFSWSELLTEGRFAAVVAQAEARGLEQVLGTASSSDLAALADAARFTKNIVIAERALRALRARFAGSPAAGDAAYLLGQLYEGKSPSSSEAESWYETYLTEAAGGAYTAEALGHKMLVVERRRGRRGAAPVAREYLDRFPDGAYATTAQAILAR
jgi:hypothetical protein